MEKFSGDNITRWIAHMPCCVPICIQQVHNNLARMYRYFSTHKLVIYECRIKVGNLKSGSIISGRIIVGMGKIRNA